MNIIFSRHGNTFGPNDPVVWTGATNDLPLAEKGVAQAEKFGHALMEQNVRPVAVYCSTLQRTRKYADVVIRLLNLPFHPTVDPRITEVDYGDWTGLTNDQVKARFGEQMLKAWDEHSQWPTGGNWKGSEAAAIAEAQSFVNDLVHRHNEDATVVVVTSNGRLRYFLTLVQGEFEKRKKDGSFKVKTGNICKLTVKDGKFTFQYWNVEPKIHF